jgi:hypothetical protein
MSKLPSVAVRFEISSWVNDQFEIANPTSLHRKPNGVMHHPHWNSDPNSGVTGTVYLAPRVVYYSNPLQGGKTAWWDMGPLPDKLEDKVR